MGNYGHKDWCPHPAYRCTCDDPEMLEKRKGVKMSNNSNHDTVVKKQEKIKPMMRQKKVDISQILKMDVKSEEFFDIYNKIREKYWTVKNPDDYQRSANILNLMSHIDDSELVITCGMIVNELFKLIKEDREVLSGQLGFKDKKIYFRFATEADGMDKMQKLMGNTVKVINEKDRK